MKIKTIFSIALAIFLGVTWLAAQGTPPPTPLLTKPEAELIRILDSTAGEKEKADACRELAVVGSKAAVPALARLLADERFNHEARHALETIPDPSVDVALRSQLTKVKGRLLVGVINSLGVRRDANAVRPLAALLVDADPTVGQAAARALGSIGTTAAAKALQKELPRASAANQPALCEGLFRSAETLLAAGNTKAAISVYEGVRTKSDLPQQIRAGALRGEIIARGSKSGALLKQSLLSPDYELFAVAIRAALELREPATTRVLAETLPLLTGDAQVVAIKALGELGDDRAVSALLPLTKAGPKATRLGAIQAVTVAGTAAVVPVLVDLLVAPDAEISHGAQDGLAAIANPAAPAAITRLLTSSSASQRNAGIELAGRRKMTAAVPALVKATGDPEESVRLAALKRLGELGSAAELPPLLQRLLKLPASRELDLAGEAARAICVRAGAHSTVAIIPAIPSAAPAAKATLLSVLGAVGGAEALETVRLALSDPNAEVHKAAVQTLAEWPDAAAIPILVQVVSAAPESSERGQAFSGWIRILRESSLKPEEKLKGLSDAATLASTLSDKRLVLAGFGDVPTIESFRALVPYLAETEVADDASASLVRIADKINSSFANEITPVLLQVLKAAKSEPVREKARAQIEQLIRNAAQKS